MNELNEVLAAIERIDAEATPPPWIPERVHDTEDSVLIIGHPVDSPPHPYTEQLASVEFVDRHDRAKEVIEERANGELIANARAWLPMLAAELRRVQREGFAAKTPASELLELTAVLELMGCKYELRPDDKYRGEGTYVDIGGGAGVSLCFDPSGRFEEAMSESGTFSRK